MTTSIEQLYRQTWEVGSRPDVFAFLRQHDVVEPSTVLAILRQDQELRWRTESPLRVEDYLEGLPEFDSVPEWKVELAVGEFESLQKTDPKLSIDEFTSRFTDVSDSIRKRLESSADIPTETLQPDETNSIELPAFAETMAPGVLEDAFVDASPPIALNANALVGRLLGEYLIKDKIGQGGMGQVYRAVHRRMHREVALKVLTTDLIDDADALKRFRREVETVSRLDHPNIVGAHDADTVNGIHFYVMELVDGDDLAENVKQHGPMGARKAVACIMDAARGLEYAHNEGIVHRDIKPHNLLLDKHGTVKVLDLGLARLELHDDETGTEGLTGTGNMLGTIDFMAPEQALDSRRADARSDIYSLGCTLYYLLTGRPLFEGESFMQKLLAHRSEPPPSIIASFPEGADELESVYQRMLAKDPDDRPQTMTQVIAELQRCLESLPEDLSGIESTDEDLTATAIHLQSQLASRSIMGGVLQGMRSSSLLSLVVGAAAVGLLWFGYGVLSGMLFPTGTLVLDLQHNDLAGTDVLLDGEPLANIQEYARTPILSVPVDGLEHTLEVKREGSKPFSQTIKFDTSDTRILHIDLVDSDTPPPNYALKFDGNGSRVEFPSLKPGNERTLTIELTIQLGENGDGLRIVEMFGPSNGLGLTMYNSKYVFGVVDLGSNPDSRFTNGRLAADIRTKSEFRPQQNTHVAIVLDETTQSLFIDGRLEGRQILELPQPTDMSFQLGKDLTKFDGVIDELRVSKVARYEDDFVPEAYLSADPETIALYHFDEGIGEVARDSSGNGHAGELVGVQWVKVPDVGTDGDITSLIQKSRDERATIPEWAVASKYNHALQFDGDGDFLEVPTLRLGDMRPFTFEAWINPDDASRSGTIFTSTATIRNPSQGCKLGLDDGSIVAIAHGSDSQDDAFASEIRTLQALSDGEDVHVAHCFDGDSQHIYINGQLIDSRRVVGARPSMTSLFIGADTDGGHTWPGTSAHFTGRMDEIRISRGCRYKDAFTPERRFLPDAQVMALYHFDEGVGDIAYDQSGNGNHAQVFNARWIRRGKVTSPISGPLMGRAPFDADQAEALQRQWADFLGVSVDFENGNGMRFRLVPPGEFYMGSTHEERLDATQDDPFDRHVYAHELDRRHAAILTPLYVGIFEVTQQQYSAVTGSNPSEFSPSGKKADLVQNRDTRQHPVETVSFAESVQFCQTLTQRANSSSRPSGDSVDSANVSRTEYRLPTETEWELACRAGSVGQFSFGDDGALLPDHAWCRDNFGNSTQPVGQLRPNAFGLFDMHGNVHEQTIDSSHLIKDTMKLNVDKFPSSVASNGLDKGGSYWDKWHYSRAARRRRTAKDFRQGFRVIFPISEEAIPQIHMTTDIKDAVLLARNGNARLAFDKLTALEQTDRPSQFFREQWSRVVALDTAALDDETILRAIQHLEWLADRGLVNVEELADSDFAALEVNLRFQLLRQRLKQNTNWRGLNRSEFAEHHWTQLYQEVTSKQTNWESFASNEFYDRHILAAILLTNDDQDRFNRFAAKFKREGKSREFAMMASFSGVDYAGLIRHRKAMLSRVPTPSNFAKYACSLYRSSNFQQALKATEDAPEPAGNAHVVNHLIKAMAMYQIGQQEEAQNYFQQNVAVLDYQPAFPWDGGPGVDACLYAILRREAEELLFGHSDFHDLCQTMSLARRGDVADALTRLEAFEARYASLSPRTRYKMARAYTQCWSHMRADSDTPREEQIRIHDRAIQLLEELESEGKLDAQNAHLAIDLRPLFDEPEFHSFCKRLSPTFNDAMDKIEVLKLCESIPNVAQESMRQSRTTDCILMLEKLADREFINAADLERPEYAALVREPRFELLKKRLQRTRNWPTRRLEFQEHHWVELGAEFLDTDDPDAWSQLNPKNDIAAVTFAAIAILNDDQSVFENHCARCVDQNLAATLLAVIAENSATDNLAVLEQLKQQQQRDPQPWHLYRIAYLHYRLGEWDLANEVAEESQTLPWNGHVMNHVVTAMAMYQQGDAEEARAYFNEKLMEFDSRKISVWEGLHEIDTATLAVVRREAEELLFDRSDSHEMDSIMSLARGGDFVAAMKRLEPFESRLENLSPRFRFSMARAYAQCWHHMRSDPNVDVQEPLRIRDRAIDLIVRLHTDGQLNTNDAHLAMDFRPLIDEPEFQAVYRRISLEFDAALIKKVVLDICDPIDNSRPARLSQAQTDLCIEQLQLAADSGSLSAAELEHSGYRKLESDMRFLLLKERLENSAGRSQPFPELFEGHWQQAHERLNGATPDDLARLIVPARIHQHVLRGGIALLAGDHDAYQRQCQEYVEQFPENPGNPDKRYFASLQLFDAETKANLDEILQYATDVTDASAHSTAVKCLALYRLGRHGEAMVEAERVRDADPNWEILAAVMRSMILHGQGDVEQARTVLLAANEKRYANLQMPEHLGFITEQILVSVIFHEAQRLVLGDGDRQEMDDIMSTARHGDFEQALIRLGPFDKRIKELAPRYRFDMARAYAQCFHHMHDEPANRRDVARRKALALLNQLVQQGTLDYRSGGCLALDLRPLHSEPEFLVLCRQVNPRLDAIVSVNKAIGESEIGQHAKAGTIAMKLLEGNRFLSGPQRRELTRILARYVSGLYAAESEQSRPAAEKGIQAVAQKLEQLAENGWLSVDELHEWSNEFPWLIEHPGFATLDSHIEAVRLQQTLLANEVFRFGGVVAVQVYDGLSGDDQWIRGKQIVISNAADLPEEPFTIWRIHIHDQEQFDDQRFSKLMDQIEAITSMYNLRLNYLAITSEGFVSLRRLGESITRLGLQDNIAFDDVCLAYLAASPQLEELYLSGTSITDHGLIYLRSLKNLRQLDLKDTNVTPAAVASLRRVLPDCNIDF